MNSKNKTTGTKDDVKAELVPKLRFPEFVDTEGWESKRLGSVGELTRGLTYSSADVASAGLLVLRSTNIQDGSLVLDKDLVFVGKPIPGALRLQAGDIVICMSNGSKTLVGKSSEYFGEHEGDITVGAFCSFFRPRLPFAKFAFHLGSYQAYIANLIAGGSINNLTNFVLEEFIFQVPRLTAEQQKIADCLSSLDELIAAQARKVDVLKTHKKGLMQQLFPREGETQPRLRFPEFQNSEEWVIDSIGNIFETTSGGTPSRTESAYWNGDVPWVTTSLVDFGVITSAEEFITAQGLKNSSAKLFPEGTVLMAMYGQGKTRGKVALLGVKAATNQACAAILPRKDIDPYFVFLNLAGRYEEIREMSNSGGQENLSQGLIREIRFSFPPRDDEQRKVTVCLGSLDAQITAETQKLDTLKTHKKGLMQQLFPSPDEATA